MVIVGEGPVGQIHQTARVHEGSALLGGRLLRAKTTLARRVDLTGRLLVYLAAPLSLLVGVFVAVTVEERLDPYGTISNNGIAVIVGFAAIMVAIYLAIRLAGLLCHLVVRLGLGEVTALVRSAEAEQSDKSLSDARAAVDELRERVQLAALDDLQERLLAISHQKPQPPS